MNSTKILMTMSLALLLVAGCSTNRASDNTIASDANRNSAGKTSAETNTNREANAAGSMDSQFAQKTASKGQMEVAMAQMAVEKAKSPDVKRFAQRIVTDHSKTNSQLMQVAQQKNMDLSGTNQNQPTMDMGSGAEFDRMFMQHMIEDHQKDIAEFERASSELNDAELKQFAQSTLPTLKEHLQMAQQTMSKLKK